MSAYSATEQHMRQNYIASERLRNTYRGEAFVQSDEELGAEFDRGMARHDALLRAEIAGAIRTNLHNPYEPTCEHDIGYYDGHMSAATIAEGRTP